MQDYLIVRPTDVKTAKTVTRVIVTSTSRGMGTDTVEMDEE